MINKNIKKLLLFYTFIATKNKIVFSTIYLVVKFFNYNSILNKVFLNNNFKNNLAFKANLNKYNPLPNIYNI